MFTWPNFITKSTKLSLNKIWSTWWHVSRTQQTHIRSLIMPNGLHIIPYSLSASWSYKLFFFFFLFFFNKEAESNYFLELKCLFLLWVSYLFQTNSSNYSQTDCSFPQRDSCSLLFEKILQREKMDRKCSGTSLFQSPPSILAEGEFRCEHEIFSELWSWHQKTHSCC